MAKREFIRREDLTELDRYKVDNGKYVGMKLGDAFDDLAISEQDIVKPYLELLLKEMHSLEEINHDDNRYDKGYQHGRASCEAMVMHMINNLLEQGDTENE